VKLIVGIPSLNESDSIGSVTRIVDEGLTLCSSLFASLQAQIVNVDGNSSDGTVGAFLSVETRWNKKAIAVPGNVGKGNNIFYLLRLSEALTADAVITLDADLKSVTPDWIVKLAYPILSGEADYVVPEYRRSPFEGSTTNHFAWPLVSIVYGGPIRQPIAGEFGLGRALVQRICKSPRPDASLFYGIDLFITLTAVTGKLRITRVALPRKLHKPSFHKLELMFPQIADVAAWFLVRWPEKGELQDASVQDPGDFEPGIDYLHKQAALDLYARSSQRVIDTIDTTDWLQRYRDEIGSRYLGERPSFTSELWAMVFASWVTYVRGNTSVKSNCGSALLPFFAMRAVTLWYDISQRGEAFGRLELENQMGLIQSKLCAM